MSDEIKNYENIDIPYNNYLSRGEITTPEGSLDSATGTKEEEIKSGDSFNDLWIRNFIRSNDWSPKKKGFYIDGRTGYAEFMNVFISGNIQALTGTIGGFTIGATTLSATSGVNTTTLSSGATAFSAGPTASPTITITQAGVITATGAIIDGTSTLGGRLASTLATAIDSSGAFINTNLNTSAKTILGSFTFSGSGAIAMNTDANNGLWLSPTGILGKKAGVNTFTIDTSGNATFAGTLSAAAGTLGTITAGTLSTVVLSAVTGTLDTITLTSPTGHIKAGQLGYDNGTGFYLGYSASTPKFSIGNSAGNKLTWDGSILGIQGNIETASTSYRLIMSSTNNAFEFRSGSTLLASIKSGSTAFSGLGGASFEHGTGEVGLEVSGNGIGLGERYVVMTGGDATHYLAFIDHDNTTFSVQMSGVHFRIPVGTNLYLP